MFDVKQIHRDRYARCLQSILINCVTAEKKNNLLTTVATKSQQVVICLKTTTFVVSTTVFVLSSTCSVGCDLLENYYLCSINNSYLFCSLLLYTVVICLKTTTFVVSTTVYKQVKFLNLCCDLLENYYLCSINNSLRRFQPRSP